MYVIYCILSFAGGYVHRVRDLTFGVDLKQIRLMGILAGTIFRPMKLEFRWIFALRPAIFARALQPFLKYPCVS
jgi:hypothetical protein